MSSRLPHRRSRSKLEAVEHCDEHAQDLSLNRKRVVAIAAAAIVFVVVVAAGVVLQRRQQVAAAPVEVAGNGAVLTTRDEASALVQRVKEHSRSQPAMKDTAHRSSLRPPGASAADAVRNVAASPERDSAEAQLVLAKALQECASNMRTDAEIEDLAAKRSLRLTQVSDFEAHPEKLLPFVTRQAEGIKKARDECMALSPGEIAQWPQILERLALAGDRAARETYVSSFWQGPDGDRWAGQVSLEEYQRAQELAREFLWERIEQGDCDNTMLNDLWRAPVGPLANYVGWSALYQRTLILPSPARANQAEADREQAFVAAENERLTRALPADQRSAADQVVTYLLGVCVQ